jgi:hypothetical protein
MLLCEQSVLHMGVGGRSSNSSRRGLGDNVVPVSGHLAIAADGKHGVQNLTDQGHLWAMPIVTGISERKERRKEVCSKATMRAGAMSCRYVCRKNMNIAAV